MANLGFLKCAPTKIVCVGLNYKDHAKKLGMKLPKEPVLFLKPSSSLIGPKDTILLPSESKRVDYEGELACVLKNTVHRLEPEDVMKNLLGFTCLNDVTARDLQKMDGQWTRAKGF